MFRGIVVFVLAIAVICLFNSFNRTSNVPKLVDLQHESGLSFPGATIRISEFIFPKPAIDAYNGKPSRAGGPGVPLR